MNITSDNVKGGKCSAMAAGSFVGVIMLMLMAAGSAGAQTATPDWVIATINGDPKYEMGFNWRTTASDQVLQIVAGSCENQTPAKCFQDGLTIEADIKSVNYRMAKATGLTAGTLYSYRVGTEGNWSETGMFTTAPADKSDFSFLYTTDPQSNTEQQFQMAGRTANAALKYFQDNDKLPGFWVMTGDHTDWNSTEEWNWYFQYQKDVFAKIPYAPIVGNHDIPEVHYGTEFFFADVFNTAATDFSPRTGVSERAGNYAFVYGDVLFFALDLEGNGTNANLAAYAPQLKTWMESEIQKHGDTKWRVAFSHRGVRSGGMHAEVGGAMARIYGELKIDFAMHGHSHVYEVLGPVKESETGGTLLDTSKYITGKISVDAAVSKTGFVGGTYNVAEGTMYFLGNRSGYKGYAMTRYRKSPFETGRISQPGDNAPGFSVVDVTGDAIIVTTYLVDAVTGEKIDPYYDRFTIIKVDPDQRLPQTVTVTPGLKIVPSEIDFDPDTYTVSGDFSKFTVTPFEIDDYVIVGGQGGKTVSEWREHKDNDPNVASISSIGHVTLKKAGTVTFTAVIAGDDTYDDATVEITLTVTDTNAALPTSDKIELTVGPNPANKSDGVIKIFVTGKHLDGGTLTVYDVSGNIVGKVGIADTDAIGSSDRRVVGSWDMKDAKGRAVADGTYLLRGVVKTLGGKRERVSLIVGVR